MTDDWHGNGYCPLGGEHLIKLALREVFTAHMRCHQCRSVSDFSDQYCRKCGRYVADDILEAISNITRLLETFAERPEGLMSSVQIIGIDLTSIELPDSEQNKQRLKFITEYVPPSCGVYIYYHPYEKYKIGKGEKIVQRRIPTHKTTAPSLRLLHVIETSDLDWCEGFLHNKFRHRRIWPNHEYFDLTKEDLDWLFRIKVLEPPRSEATQLRLLDLL